MQDFICTRGAWAGVVEAPSGLSEFRVKYCNKGRFPFVPFATGLLFDGQGSLITIGNSFFSIRPESERTSEPDLGTLEEAAHALSGSQAVVPHQIADAGIPALSVMTNTRVCSVRLSVSILH
jgi:hypothetical protein